MYVARNVSLRLIIQFAWMRVILFTITSVIAVFLFTCVNRNFAIPFLPVTLIGTAVAFYVGFKNNASYNRLWEARQSWGGIVNNSRSWAMMVQSFINNNLAEEKLSDAELAQIHRRLIYRQLAWTNVLRLQLRRLQTWEHHLTFNKKFRDYFDKAYEVKTIEEELARFVSPEEAAQLMNKQNIATHLLAMQSRDLAELRKRKLMDEYRHIELEEVLKEFYNEQGRCERIKNFPFPRQYAFFSQIFIWIFIVLLPFGLVSEMKKYGDLFVWFTVPFSVLISWVFMTMELVGDYSENPFENLINDVPMLSLCRTIEIDLMEMLGETNIPPKIKPVNDILL